MRSDQALLYFLGGVVTGIIFGLVCLLQVVVVNGMVGSPVEMGGWYGGLPPLKSRAVLTAPLFCLSFAPWIFRRRNTPLCVGFTVGAASLGTLMLLGFVR